MGSQINTYTGSMADVPKNLLAQINKLEEMFTVPKEKLKQITDHFVNELTKGLTAEGGSIVRITSSSPAQSLALTPYCSAYEPHLVHEFSYW